MNYCPREMLIGSNVNWLCLQRHRTTLPKTAFQVIFLADLETTLAYQSVWNRQTVMSDTRSRSVRRLVITYLPSILQ